jgi:hypothetical protein
MTHVRNLVLRWNDEAHELELKAINREPGSVEELQLQSTAMDKRIHAAQLEAAILRDKIDALEAVA